MRKRKYKTTQIKKKKIQESLIKHQVTTLDNLFLPRNQKGKENEAKLSITDLTQHSQDNRNNYNE